MRQLEASRTKSANAESETRVVERMTVFDRST